MRRPAIKSRSDQITAAVLRQIGAERKDQMEYNGYDRRHDDEHIGGEIAHAASCYAFHASRPLAIDEYRVGAPPPDWPWEPGAWNPKNRRRDLIKAAALIVAEIERLDRAPMMPRDHEGRFGQ